VEDKHIKSEEEKQWEGHGASAVPISSKKNPRVAPNAETSS